MKSSMEESAIHNRIDQYTFRPSPMKCGRKWNSGRRARLRRCIPLCLDKLRLKIWDAGSVKFDERFANSMKSFRMYSSGTSRKGNKAMIPTDFIGGVDGARTRDPRRDRPVF